MPQRKEKSDKPAHYNQEACLDLFFLESPDPETVDSVRNMIQENLSRSKDPRLLYNLVDFYVATQSKNSLEILLHVREPHEKHLFDKINEMMKTDTTRYNALQLLGNIVYKQPSWLHKIASQRVMHTLLQLLKTDLNSPNLLSGLFILICLLPMIPHLFGTFLPDTFDIFSRLAAWNIKKPSTLSDILNLHLQTGIYSLFHRLYGMFPCNFLAYLRSFYGGRDCTSDNYKVFSLVIKPMLERVRLHPLLVTASKEAELNVNRWKKMAYHDIIVDCASVSLDAIEGALENFKMMNVCVSSHSEKISSYESVNSSSFQSQSNTSVAVDSDSAIINTTSSNQDHIWSPSQVCGANIAYSNSQTSPTGSKGEWEFKNVMQSSMEERIPLDFAVEAKPELLKSELENTEKNSNREKEILFQNNITSSDSTSLTFGKSVLSSIENKEDDFDKEVSELTSSQTKEQIPTDEIRQDTPFCSTTQTLTDEPTKFTQAISSFSERSDSLTKSTDEDVDEMYNSMQEPDIQPYVPTFNRYRFFSHCGPPPDLTPNIRRIKVFRSKSCPAELCQTLERRTDIKTYNMERLEQIETVKVTCNSNVITSATTSAFVPLISENSLVTKDALPIYQQLLPAVINPLQDFELPIVIGVASDSSQNRNQKSLSPPELLDLYIQQGNAAYLSHLPLTSTKDTDWTHFGGNPPPEEIEALRNQILLLHNMLLFERHRKDIHSERNRRILGRAKRTRMQEEYVEALKKEIIILTEENGNLKSELTNQYKLYQQLQVQKKLSENEWDFKMSKIGQENTQLLFSNKQLQTLLVSQKEENDEIREVYKKTQSDVVNFKCQLKFAHKEMQHCQKVKREAIFLTKQLILLQELNAQYKTKIDQLKEPQQPDIGTKLMNNSMIAEIKDLKQKLDTKTVLLDSAKGKINELENILSNLKLKQREKASSCEKMKNYHQAEIMACEERLCDLRKVSTEKDAHILKLYADLDTLNEKIDSLEKKLKLHIPSDTNNESSCSRVQYPNFASVDKSTNIQRYDKAVS